MGSNPGNQEIAEREAVKTQEPAWVAEIRGKLATIVSFHVELIQEVKGLRAYVEKIEAEAHASMEKFSSPEAMMEMAGKFLGTG